MLLPWLHRDVEFHRDKWRRSAAADHLAPVTVTLLSGFFSFFFPYSQTWLTFPDKCSNKASSLTLRHVFLPFFGPQGSFLVVCQCRISRPPSHRQVFLETAPVWFDLSSKHKLRITSLKNAQFGRNLCRGEDCINLQLEGLTAGKQGFHLFSQTLHRTLVFSFNIYIFKKPVKKTSVYISAADIHCSKVEKCTWSVWVSIHGNYVEAEKYSDNVTSQYLNLFTVLYWRKSFFYFFVLIFHFPPQP